MRHCKRGVITTLVLAVASPAFAGAIIDLVPSAAASKFNPCGAYAAGEVVTIEVFIGQDPAATGRYLRLMQLDFTTSDDEVVPSAISWENTSNHFQHLDDLGGSNKRYSNTFHGDLVTPDLGLDTTRQLLLPGDGSMVKAGEFTLTMPGTPGDFTLNVLNAGSSDPDRGAQIRFGYSLSGTDPVTVWRADTGDLTGGLLNMSVVDQALMTSKPDFDRSLWRSSANIVRLTFDRDITTPTSGMIEIRELLPNGAVGANLSASFSFLVEDDEGSNPRILRIQDTGSNLTHRSWYTIRNTGAWTAVDVFHIDYIVQAGDANGDGRVLFNDLGAINTGVGCFSGCGDDNRFDINGDNRILFNDLGAANTFVGSFPVAKPSGHSCQ